MWVFKDRKEKLSVLKIGFNGFSREKNFLSFLHARLNFDKFLEENILSPLQYKIIIKKEKKKKTNDPTTVKVRTSTL